MDHDLRHRVGAADAETGEHWIGRNSPNTCIVVPSNAASPHGGIKLLFTHLSGDVYCIFTNMKIAESPIDSYPQLPIVQMQKIDLKPSSILISMNDCSPLSLCVFGKYACFLPQIRN